MKKFTAAGAALLFYNILFAGITPKINGHLGGMSDAVADTVFLFNGNNLDAFEFVLDGNNPKPEYKIENGEIYFAGGQKGYFKTKENYSEFRLHAEWRWPEANEKGNSGILVFTQKPDTVWPSCIQVQLKNGSAGDLIAMNKVQLEETAGKQKDTAEKFSSSSEKPEEQWNECNVVCRENSIEVFVNGILQNRGTGCNFNEGTIGFQLEGKPVMFRNLSVEINK